MSKHLYQKKTRFICEHLQPLGGMHRSRGDSQGGVLPCSWYLEKMHPLVILRKPGCKRDL